MSPDASDFGASEDDTTGFAPAVEEGPRKDANVLAALDADSEMAGASAGFCGGPARGEGANVKGVVALPIAPNPEKLPNLCAGC